MSPPSNNNGLLAANWKKVDKTGIQNVLLKSNNAQNLELFTGIKNLLLQSVDVIYGNNTDDKYVKIIDMLMARIKALLTEDLNKFSNDILELLYTKIDELLLKSDNKKDNKENISEELVSNDKEENTLKTETKVKILNEATQDYTNLFLYIKLLFDIIYNSLKEILEKISENINLTSDTEVEKSEPIDISIIEKNIQDGILQNNKENILLIKLTITDIIAELIETVKTNILTLITNILQVTLSKKDEKAEEPSELSKPEIKEKEAPDLQALSKQEEPSELSKPEIKEKEAPDLQALPKVDQKILPKQEEPSELSKPEIKEKEAPDLQILSKAAPIEDNSKENKQQLELQKLQSITLNNILNLLLSLNELLNTINVNVSLIQIKITTLDSILTKLDTLSTISELLQETISVLNIKLDQYYLNSLQNTNIINDAINLHINNIIKEINNIYTNLEKQNSLATNIDPKLIVDTLNIIKEISNKLTIINDSILVVSNKLDAIRQLLKTGSKVKVQPKNVKKAGNNKKKGPDLTLIILSIVNKIDKKIDDALKTFLKLSKKLGKIIDDINSAHKKGFGTFIFIGLLLFMTLLFPKFIKNIVVALMEFIEKYNILGIISSVVGKIASVIADLSIKLIEYFMPKIWNFIKANAMNFITKIAWPSIKNGFLERLEYVWLAVLAAIEWIKAKCTGSNKSFGEILDEKAAQHSKNMDISLDKAAKKIDTNLNVSLTKGTKELNASILQELKTTGSDIKAENTKAVQESKSVIVQTSLNVQKNTTSINDKVLSSTDVINSKLDEALANVDLQTSSVLQETTDKLDLAQASLDEKVNAGEERTQGVLNKEFEKQDKLIEQNGAPTEAQNSDVKKAQLGIDSGKAKDASIKDGAPNVGKDISVADLEDKSGEAKVATDTADEAKRRAEAGADANEKAPKASDVKSPNINTTQTKPKFDSVADEKYFNLILKSDEIQDKLTNENTTIDEILLYLNGDFRTTFDKFIELMRQLKSKVEKYEGPALPVVIPLGNTLPGLQNIASMESKREVLKRFFSRLY